MTDALLAAEQAQALIRPDVDARLAAEQAQVLLRADVDARLAAEQAQALVRPGVDARLAALQVQVLHQGIPIDSVGVWGAPMGTLLAYPTDGLLCHVDAQDSAFSGIADGGAVSSFTDTAPTPNSITVSGTLNRYATITNAGGPAFRNASGGYMILPSTLFSGKTAGHLFMMVKSVPTSGEVGGQWRFGGNDSAWFPYSDGKVYDGSFTSTRYSFTPTIDVRAKWRIAEIEHNGTTWTYRIDGTAQSTQTVGFTAPSSNLWLMKASAGVPHYAMAGFLAYDRALSADDAAAVRAYLTARHGAVG